MVNVKYKIVYNNVLAYFIIIFVHSTEINCARILAYFPVPSISHQVVFRPLTQELANRGHKVTVITPDPAFLVGKTPTNLLEIDVQNLSYKIWQEKGLRLFNRNMHELMAFAYLLLNEIFIAQFKSDQVQNILNNKNTTFDLVLTEACVETTLVLGYLYKVPVIQVSSLGDAYKNHDVIGSPNDALTYHQVFRKRIYNLSYLEEIIEYYNYIIITNIFDHVTILLDQILKEAFGEDTPSLKKLKSNVSMLYLNVHPLWDNRPVPTGVVYMGGISLSHQKNDTTKDLKTFLDSSLKGVVYMSFGSNVQLSTLPPEKVQIFLKVFAELPYNVLLKCDLKNLEGLSSNVKVSEWFPQVYVLRHHNVKVFVTQGGLQSIEESIHSAVPIIGIPINADQYLNVEQCVHYGFGIRLDMDLVTENTFKYAILSIVTNSSYHLNIMKFRSWMLDQPQSSLSRAVWWTEYVLRHGGAQHLRAPAANMPWTEKLEINLVLTVIIASLLFACLFLYALYALLKRLFHKCYYILMLFSNKN